jgi:FkbM family methyltransferase
MYYGQFGIDQFLHETFFTNKRDGFFVECGATDGVLETTCKFFEDSLGWTGINIEASPPLYEMLIQNRPKCINWNIGLSNQDGIATFTHAISPDMGTRFGNGSLTHHPAHIADLVNQGCSFQKFQVQCKKFSQMFNPSLKEAYREIDLFVLDIEGHECQALTGIMELGPEVLPRVFCIEHSFSGLGNIAQILGPRYKQHSIQQQNVIFLKQP